MEIDEESFRSSSGVAGCLTGACRVDDLHKEPVHTAIRRQLRVKGCGHHAPLADKRRGAVTKSKGLHAGADFGKAWSSNEDHFQRTAGKIRFGVEDGRIDLPAVGVAFDHGIEHSDAGLRGIPYLARQKNGAGAGPEDRLRAAELFQSLKETMPLQELQHGRRFATRQNQSVETGKILRLAYFDRYGVHLFQRRGVGGIVALNREDTDAGMSSVLQARFPSNSKGLKT